MTYRLREVHLSILPKGSPTIRVLHFSDLHLTPSRKREISKIRSWVDLKPDLVISTGDFLGHQSAIETALFALDPLLSIPGLYVFGSNDYYGPRFKNPLSYLKRDDGNRKLGSRLNTAEFDNRLQSRGWKNLNSSKVEILIKEISIEARGTDDAHLDLDNYSLVAGQRDPKVSLSIGVTHAPYKRVLDAMTNDGLDLVFAGHTHGGQVRVPWFGGTRSLTTNCDLPNWRSRGLTKLENEPYLHVSAGMGYNPFTPIRFLCPSEATLLALKSKS
ncbi:MAG: metallophosphoesterase [Actinobacteria bacterium]|nr:metallophosphoesterase [Actinomycetota bacterium]